MNNTITFNISSDDLLPPNGNPVSICMIGIYWKTTGALGYHWSDYSGTTLADAITQWFSSGHPELVCIIGTHLTATGITSTLGCYWNHTGWCYHPVVSMGNPVVICIIGTHRKTTGSTLGAHWKHIGYQQFVLLWHSKVHRETKSQAQGDATGLPLDCHWFTTGSGKGQAIFHGLK